MGMFIGPIGFLGVEPELAQLQVDVRPAEVGYVAQPEAVVKAAQDHAVPFLVSLGGFQEGPDLAVGKRSAFLPPRGLVWQAGDALGLIGFNQVILKGVRQGRLDTI